MDTDGDGTREDGDGNPITFTLATNTQNSVREIIGTIIQEGLEDIGIAAEYRLIDFGELVAQLTRSYDWDAILVGFGEGSDPYSGIGFWHSSEDLHIWYPNQPQPATSWEAEIDDLYVRASQELDEDERIMLYRRAQTIAAENVPVIYTTQGERLSAVRNVFGNTTTDTVRHRGHALPVSDGPVRAPCADPEVAKRGRFTVLSRDRSAAPSTPLYNPPDFLKDLRQNSRVRTTLTGTRGQDRVGPHWLAGSSGCRTF